MPFPSPTFDQESKDQVDDIQRSILKDKKKKKNKKKKNKNRAGAEESMQQADNSNVVQE